MIPYALGTFSFNNGPKFVGLVIEEKVALISQLAELFGCLATGADASMLKLLESWEQNLPAIDQLVSRSQSSTVAWHSISEVHVHPPVDLPRQIFCVGANYRKHVVDMTVDAGIGPKGLDRDALRQWAEKVMDERAATGEPYVFTKPISAIAGAFDTLVLPRNTHKPDWELELGAVVGKGGHHISRADALSHVAGYAIVNDISARDLIPRKDYEVLGTDWLRSKGQVGFFPFGPYLVPAKFIANPQQLKMQLRVSGKIMQDESTADMIFDVARQIEYISSYVRLLPGDVIATGSPAGNGTHYNRFLQPGDIMEAEIEGLGHQRVSCIAAVDD